MRILSKMSLAALAVVIPTAFAACNGGGGDEEDMGGSDGSGGSDTDGSGGNDTDGSGGNDTDGSGGASGGSDTGGQGGMGAMGGVANTGGNGSGGQAPTEPPFTPEQCTAPAGPGAAVRESGIGAFLEDASWMDGWTNWSMNSTPEDDGSDPTQALDADIDADLTLDAAEIYEIVGIVHVLDGATLTIPAGTLFKSTGNGTLVVSRGGRLVAEGTAEEPIVFTSQAANGVKAAGQWGGVVILGQATNWSGPNVNIEGLATDPLNQHGDAGDAIEDQDSGSLSYVRIEFGGTELLDGSEINGLTLGSVGSGTSISYVQVNTTWDDGFEWFGGSASGDHLVSNSAGDDIFDIDQGFVGELDTLFGRQMVTVKADPNGFEWDSSLSDLQPATHPVVSNVTLCGVPDGKPNYGMVLREFIEGDVENVAFTGFDYGIDLRDEVSEDLSITSSYSWGHYGGIANVAEADNDGGVVESDWFLDQDGNVDFDQ